MPRRREVPKREILPDPKFGSVELSKFMNVIMEGGKKAVADLFSLPCRMPKGIFSPLFTVGIW